MHFVIAGRLNCPQFSYAVMVAQRLKENLPDFTYLKIPKRPEEWEVRSCSRWLVKTCEENVWYHVKSPIIWREIGMRNGKKEFVGDINKFLDLCYDYYGVPREVLSAESFNRGEMNWFKNRTETDFSQNVKLEAKKRREYRSRQVCITGASSQVTEILIMELLQISSQRREDGLEIRLFDEKAKEKKLLSSANDAKHCPGPSGFGNCRVATSLKEALNNVDLVIVLDSFGRKPKESIVKWLKRNRNAMCALGKALKLYAPSHCRVIIGSPSNQPICYNATVLASFATNLHVRNIVAVTQDLGREMLKPLSVKCNSPLKDFYCPPVWGFVGLNKFIDVCKTLQTHLYKVPGKRLHSTIPQGSEEYELRTTECQIDESGTRELHVKVAEHKAESYPQLGRWPCLAKATAILDLLKVWGIKREDGNGEILTLGVYSDGTFNIPKGIYWSQPVVLVKGFWIPFPDFPIPRSSYLNIYCLFLYSIASLYRTKVKPRIFSFPEPKPKPKEIKRFDFDKVLEEIGMPVIRTDAECVKYLKYLAKVELGIDFDAIDDVIEEEDEEEEEEVVVPTEQVERKQIYCECWREELKELQKIVFDRSSTTEVEMDLSDNISGSEWSVINPTAPMSSTSELSERGKESESKTLGSADVVKICGTKDTESSSTLTVCSCGALATGSLCQCLVKAAEEEESEEDKISTEHFYKEQNAQVFDEDLKDAIYADDYVGEKHVSFDDEAKLEDADRSSLLKLYGKQDAIRDEMAERKRRERIAKYERGGEESIEGEEGEGGEMIQDRESSLSTVKSEEDELKEAKFHISIEGVSYDIIGDRDGLEQLDEMRRSVTDKESVNTFREMYSDKITSGLQVIPPDLDKSTESSLMQLSIFGEGSMTFFSDLKESSEKKDSEKQLSLGSYEEGLWEEKSLSKGIEAGGEEEEEEDEEEVFKEDPCKKKKRKRQGIPLCCLCRCIVPDGLPCCPCGATTVVEVFKKESIEVLIENEDSLSYRVQYFETIIHPESRPSSEMSLEIEPEEEKIPKRDLPPESFFPFSPKIENVFKRTQRPFQMTEEYISSKKKKTKKSVPDRCLELLNMAKMHLREEYEGEDGESKLEPDRMPELTSCFGENSEIKTDFSDLNLFIPDGLEDWRTTVQKKYREWFFEGPNIRDDSYYDIAIEEVSEDEFEVDKDLEQYFEC